MASRPARCIAARRPIASSSAGASTRRTWSGVSIAGRDARAGTRRHGSAGANATVMEGRRMWRKTKTIDLTIDERRLSDRDSDRLYRNAATRAGTRARWRMDVRQMFTSTLRGDTAAVDFARQREQGFGRYLLAKATARWADGLLGPRPLGRLPRRPGHRTAADEMQVDVKYRLAGLAFVLNTVRKPRGRRCRAPLRSSRRRAPSRRRTVVAGDEIVQRRDVAASARRARASALAG